MADYTVLKTEINTDPLSLGYSGKTDVQVAALMNTVRPDQAIDRTIIPSWEVIEATVAAEWASLTSAEKQRYQTIVGAGQINVKGANTRAAFLAMFGAGTQTRTNLAALQTTPATRAERIWGVAVNDIDIAKARTV